MNLRPDGLKACFHCGEDKPGDAFHRNKARPDGLSGKCKQCYSLWAKETGKPRARAKSHYAANRQSIAKINSARKKANRGKHNEYARRAYAATGNTARRLETLRAYQARKRQAMPKWADRSAMLLVYEAAKSTGMEVDHIVPLRHPLVCGLHNQFNLQLLTKADNASKGNRTWPDMP